MTFGIPKFEPEVVQAGVKKLAGRVERVPTTAIRKLFIDGIEVRSPYGNAAAMELICSMVERIDQQLQDTIAAISCVGRNHDMFVVNVMHCSINAMYEIADIFETICIERNGRHGGIVFFWPDNWNQREHNYFRPPTTRVPMRQRDSKKVD